MGPQRKDHAEKEDRQKSIGIPEEIRIEFRRKIKKRSGKQGKDHSIESLEILITEFLKHIEHRSPVKERIDQHQKGCYQFINHILSAQVDYKPGDKKGDVKK